MSPENKLKVVARLPNSVVHSYIDGELIYSTGNRIYSIKLLEGLAPCLLGKIPWKLHQQISRIRIVDRVLKFSILQVQKTSSGEFLVSTGRNWWFLSEGEAFPVTLSSDTRPMNRGICESAGMLYVAEYTSNPDRGPVRIFGSNDGLRFESVWEFHAKEIRHVHALISDQEQNRIWILTGDLDNESRIYYTDDQFSTVKILLAAGQLSRATDMLIKDGTLFWCMDSPIETSYVMRMDIDGDQPEKIFELPGPGYYMTQNEAGCIYFGTTVEPGPAVKDDFGHFYRLSKSRVCEELFSCKNDIWPQYGIFYFPKGILPDNFIVYSQRALRPFEGYLTIARDFCA